jgi:hypothetical protein
MISVKNYQLNTETITAINAFIELDLPANIAFKLMRIVKELSSLVDDKLKLEKKIFDKYVVKDEMGNPLPAVDEKGTIIPNAAKISDVEAFNREMQDLNEASTDIEFEKLNFEDLKLETAKARDLIVLEFLFS